MNILVVDDERLALDGLINELEKVFPNAKIHGERMASLVMPWVENLKEQEETLSYAFLDIEMGSISGLELARQLKDIYPHVKLIFCTAYSEYAINAYGLCAKGYLLKPIQAKDIEHVLDEMVMDWREEINSRDRDIRVQTFGHFEVFVDGNPLVFERSKAKELLAYLVDRHGSSVTTEQIAMILWEDAVYDRKLKNMATTIIASLRNTLNAAGIGDIIIKSWNHLSLDVSKIKCDAYDYEKWDVIAVNSYHGEYMVNYSWAEFTNGKYATMEEKTNKE